MTPLDALLLFSANFGFIALKAFQQRNVAFDNYVWVLPTSIGMASMEVFVIAKIAVIGYSLGIILAVGLAGGTGALTAMLLHRRFIK